MRYAEKQALKAYFIQKPGARDALQRVKMKVFLAPRLSMKIHDRYLISGDKCWPIGASIKDLGNTDTVIKEISEVTGD